ncbi:MAG: hypothetical protein M1823_002574 [Watsoniomyces obsoletus]|nr:MAG: hypothetical protein M1823_002574 [Watsoniomyces obsoletus]
MDEDLPFSLDFGMGYGDEGEDDHQPDVASGGALSREPSKTKVVPLTQWPLERLGVSQAEGPSAVAQDAPSTMAQGKGEDAGPRKSEQTKRPLQLLDLPADILREIVKQITHTNDLTSLALTHSALHNLAIPHIYSRFDIVWPDAHSADDPSTGVDALTFGLATLVMGDEIFSRDPSPETSHQTTHARPCYKCGAWPESPSPSSDRPEESPSPIPRTQWRKGNRYARFTRKFSLGNGPSDLVAEYLISKERGKMLGTLVALALARMPNLETFIWDMPSGVLRDVWLALASLGDRQDASGCRLKQVWVRWHDNSQVTAGEGSVNPNSASASTQTSAPVGVMVAPGTHITPLLSTPHTHGAPSSHPASRTERPTFSVLPPLESLTVLDIDEQTYLDEMSILVGKSQHSLRELRLGIATQAGSRDWVKSWDSDELVQVDHNATWLNLTAGGTRRLGGVLGVVIGRVYDLHRRRLRAKGAFKAVNADGEDKPASPLGVSFWPVVNAALSPINMPGGPGMPLASTEPTNTPGASPGTLNSLLPPGMHGAVIPPSVPDSSLSAVSNHAAVETPLEGGKCRTKLQEQPRKGSTKPSLDGKLKLDLLELERVPLYVPALHKAFDWTVMTSLTILNCGNHEQLWKMARRCFGPASGSSPPSKVGGHATKLGARTVGHPQPGARPSHKPETSDYPLKLKKIHTDMVSNSLIAFLRETLAPNSLEVLILLEGSTYSSPVTISSIYRGPLRRHRKSLKKVMIDSSDRALNGDPIANRQGWKKWMLTNEVLSFIVSGKLSALRELGVALDAKDWHFFLQRLPMIPHLRALFVTHMTENSSPVPPDPKELALQVVDIVTLRPEVELCYLALFNKCFEIVEGKQPDESQTTSASTTGQANAGTGVGATTDTDASDLDDDDEDDMGDDDEDDEDDDGTGTTDASNEGHDMDSDASIDSTLESEDELDPQLLEQGPRVTLRLREILFYDERVAVFKARHGRL